MQIQEASSQHSERALEYLGIAQELCTKAVGSRGTRQAYFIGRLMAKEHLVSGDPATAHKLLLLVAGQPTPSDIAKILRPLIPSILLFPVCFLDEC